MKTSLTLVLSVLFFSAQAQYTVNWGIAPINPLPDIYILNHHKIDGNVTTYTDVIEKTVIIFNKDGKAVSKNDPFGKTAWVYDNSGHLIQQKWGDSPNSMVHYKTNENGFITSIIYNSGRTQTINYDQNGLLFQK
ncbi:hypothetical protein [Aequorivita sublithincola]|uniref:hypothetical protein n=1 Tax=Aequorivita sublithincola TaxID=101385 RepID=UPI0002D749F8|nr:hypothetical protein [Aequorivita sublithincola]